MITDDHWAFLVQKYGTPFSIPCSENSNLWMILFGRTRFVADIRRCFELNPRFLVRL